LIDNVRKRANLSYSQELIEDIKDSWPIFLVAFILSIVFCFIFYWLLEHFTGCMIFLMLGGSIAAFIGFGTYNWLQYQKWNGNS